MRLSPDRERFVRRCVAYGSYATPAEAVEAALRMLEERGTTTPLQRAATLGLEQVVAGRGSPFTVDDVKRRAFRRSKPR